MTYEEALVIVEGLRGRMNVPFSFEDRQLIERTYAEVMQRPFVRRGCNNCYKDGVIEMAVQLNKEKKMREKCNYHMRAGYIIRNENFENGNVYSNENLTDDVAKRYLEMFPSAVQFFDRIPENKAVDSEKPKSETTTQPTKKKAVKGGRKSK